ncbi:MlaD family protein [Mycobacterium vicinigordonae]|uniref:MCE family protein n=1 Tax=Mycobacterium vicinigordonae TaxID=1719132 RepID=A0A7D6E191_9MYCO|nr:MlaD family protein [Mycobacterium vicinigordonae]QLL07381.1 MCE family protein [Mycobacterium vicinigordonae]
MKPPAASWRLALSAVVAIVLFVLVANTITQPTATDVRSYTADFTDASGLHLDADIRVRGVRVGKVQSVELQRRGGQSIAAVRFTLEKRYGVVSGTRLAIKYQALTGLRYVDIQNPTENYTPAALVNHVSTAMTEPSFDITALFNGLQPVLATLNPDELNTFTANAATYLSGDGGGLAPMLTSIRKLTRFVSDRERTISTLMRNLSDVAATMKTHSKDLIQLVDWVNRPMNGALDVLDEFRKSQVYGGEFTDAVLRILTNIGFPRGANSGAQFVYGTPNHDATDIDAGLDRAFTVLDDFTDAFKLVPVMWENIPPPSRAGEPQPCSQGRAQLPEQMDILLNGRRVVLCNR